MFGIGTGELLLIAFIALIVLGPERMPQLMRDVGKAMGDLRKTSEELQQEFLNADRKIDPMKVLDAAGRATAADAAPPVTQAEVATPAEPAAAGPAAAPPSEPEETAFDREARLARERIDRLG